MPPCPASLRPYGHAQLCTVTLCQYRQWHDTTLGHVSTECSFGHLIMVILLAQLVGDDFYFGCDSLLPAYLTLLLPARAPKSASSAIRRYCVV
eukprot:2242651-Rhodomonas_salina.1